MKDVTVCASQIPLCSSDALSHGKHQLLLFSAELAAPYRPCCSPRDSAIQLYPCLFDMDELESDDRMEGKQDNRARGRLPEATAQEELPSTPCLHQFNLQAPKVPMGTSYLNSFRRKHSILYCFLVAKQEESSLCPTGEKSVE